VAGNREYPRLYFVDETVVLHTTPSVLLHPPSADLTLADFNKFAATNLKRDHPVH
jgi:hypothetical protein